MGDHRFVPLGDGGRLRLLMDGGDRATAFRWEFDAGEGQLYERIGKPDGKGGT